MKKNIKKKKGFTLIELIIVVAVLGILALIAVPKFGEIQKNSKEKADMATAKTIADTAVMLVAKGDIEVNTANVSAANGSAGYGTTITLQDAGGSGKAIADGLQKVPSVQSNKNKKFYIKIEQTTGNVTVYIDANGATLDNTTQVYPQ